MKKLLIVFHSLSGSTRSLAEEACCGARLELNVDVRLLRAMEADIGDLLWCDAVLFGTPENLGFMSGGLKDFFDRTFYPALRLGVTPPYGLFVSAGNDGSGAVRQLQRIVKGYPLRCVAEPIIVVGAVNDDARQQCRDLGQAIAAGLSMGIF